ncbi:Uncharacterised protein [Mycobacteroides abscessus subsp. abscessus]|nr:Uncharacterised protein [Mycobacteroides abscessus subsp. abscessus]
MLILTRLILKMLNSFQWASTLPIFVSQLHVNYTNKKEPLYKDSFLNHNGFPFQQCFYHCVGNVLVIFQNIAGYFILLINNTTNFSIYLLLGCFRNRTAT